MYYNYKENVTDDITRFLIDNYSQEEIENLTSNDKERLLDDLRIEDSVTGNGSGSYTFSRIEAMENLEGNEDLVERVVNEFGVDMSKHWNDYEYLDVSIRCLLLYECIDDAIEQFLHIKEGEDENS